MSTTWVLSEEDRDVLRRLRALVALQDQRTSVTDVDLNDLKRALELLGDQFEWGQRDAFTRAGRYAEHLRTVDRDLDANGACMNIEAWCKDRGISARERSSIEPDANACMNEAELDARYDELMRQARNLCAACDDDTVEPAIKSESTDWTHHNHPVHGDVICPAGDIHDRIGELLEEKPTDDPTDKTEQELVKSTMPETTESNERRDKIATAFARELNKVVPGRYITWERVQDRFAAALDEYAGEIAKTLELRNDALNMANDVNRGLRAELADAREALRWEGTDDE